MLLSDLNQAAKQATPSADTYYTKAVVLALEWQIGDSNIKLASSRDKLLQTFEITYGFAVERFRIKEGLRAPAQATRNLQD